MKPILVIPAVGLALLVAVSPEAGAGKFSGLGRTIGAGLGKTAAAGAGSAREPDLSRDALRACLTLEERIKSSADTMLRERKALEAKSATLEAQFANLDARRARLDRSNSGAVDQFNVRLNGLQSRAKAYDGDVSEYNARLNTYWREAARFDADCAGRSYREGDMRAIQDEAGRKNLPAAISRGEER